MTPRRKDFQRKTKGEQDEIIALLQRLIPPIGLANLEFVPLPVDRCWTRGCDPAAWVVVKTAAQSRECDRYAGHQCCSRVTDASQLGKEAAMGIDLCVVQVVQKLSMSPIRVAFVV